MPKLDSYPKELRPYIFHGLELEWKRGKKDAISDCPDCQAPRHFGVEVKTSKYNCFRCKMSGNSKTFLRWLLDKSEACTFSYELLQKLKPLNKDTFMSWMIVESVLNGDWLVPGYSASGHLVQLYRHCSFGTKRKLLATPTFSHGIFGVNLYDSKKSMVFLTEGPWDAMALWEQFGQIGVEGGDYKGNGRKPKVVQAVGSGSTLNDANVLGVPGCMSFQKEWAPLFAGRDVVICFDSDHPREESGRMVESSGLQGVKHVAKILATCEPPINTLRYLRWGPGGYDSGKPSGYDVSDLLWGK